RPCCVVAHAGSNVKPRGEATMRPSRGCGGIGRRARFRSVWAKARGGSSPLIRIAGSSGFGALRPRARERPGHPSAWRSDPDGLIERPAIKVAADLADEGEADPLRSGDGCPQQGGLMRLRFVALLAVASTALFCFAGAASTAVVQHGLKLTGAGETGAGQLGSSIAISADG